MKQYDVSVIIPIYNCEEYIEQCLESIYNQDYSELDKIQVILINDGSTDNSLEICNKLKEKYKDMSIELINGKNQGVSKARNKGVKEAKGKYIMFLDADDFISRNAIRVLKEFFDEHYEETDVVTYPIYYYYQQSKKRMKLSRYDDFYKGTNVYSLKKDYYLIQPNMNIIIKNEFENNILFDEEIKFHEDEKYNIDLSMKKLSIGYVEDVKYFYRRYEEGTTESLSNPYYCFEDFMHIYEYYIENYADENKHLPKYIQCTILNDIRWRLLQDKLFPYFYEEQKFQESIDRIKDVLNYVENRIIIQNKYIDRYHKIYLLNLKGAKFDIYTNHKNIFTINYEKEVVDIVNNIEIVLNRFKVKNKKIYILGYIKSPIFMFKDVELYIKYKNNENKIEEKKIELSESTRSFHKSNVKVANFKMFEYEIDMTTVKKFEFITKIEGEIIPEKYNFGKYCTLSKNAKNYKIYDKEYRVQYKANGFYINIPNKKTRIKDFIKLFIKYNKKNFKINFFRLCAKTNKKIWIYNDRIGVFDNAYLQFKHDINIKDGIHRYYALDGNFKDNKDKFSLKEKKHILKFGSLKHKVLYMKSDKIITSFSNIQEFCPLYRKMEDYKDIWKQDIIYLQHGVLHATCIKIYSKEYTNLDKIVISSGFEKKNFIEKYKYSKKDLITCGMPRLDDNISQDEIQNKIIFAPSWRNYLIGPMIERKRKIDKEKFVKSKYYLEIVEFLQNERLLRTLKKNNIIIDFKMHPIFEPYKKCFEFLNNDNVNISSGKTKLSEYKAFITDFSSYQFDFVKLQRPITYFIPDREEFKAGLHLYRELDLRYEDAFGKLCFTGEELVNEIINLINNNFEMESIYKERMEKFFFKVKNRKDRLYDILKED